MNEAIPKEPTPKEPVFNLRRAWCLMPLLSLLLVFTLSEIVRPASGIFETPYETTFSTIAQCPEKSAPSDPVYLASPAGSLEAFGNDVNGRIRWAGAAAVSTALGLVTLLVCALLIGRQLCASVKHPALVLLAAMAALGAMAAFVLSTGKAGDLPQTVCYVCVLVAIIGHALNHRVGVIAGAILVLAVAAWVVTKLPIPAWVSDAQSVSTYRVFALTMPLFDRLQAVLFTPEVGWPWFDRAIGGLCTIVVIALAVGVCALVTDCRREAQDDAGLRARAESLRLLLYLGGGVLVSGVVYIKLLHDWPLALICGKQAGTLFTELSSHWPVVVATYWSLMLIAIFVPAQISLARAARKLASRQLKHDTAPVSEKEIGAWLDERGLRASPAKQIAQFVALLSPWLTSVPVAGLFDYVKLAFGS
jgi:hypothetical protein